MPHTYTSLKIHIVFSTKERRPLLDATLEERLYPYLGGILREIGGGLMTANGADDHVHLLAYVPPTEALSDVIGRMKGSSSAWIHETFPEHAKFEWQRGFGAFSVSPSQLPLVTRYIERQKEHHRRISFRDEFIALLRRHGFNPDERSLWT